MLIRKIGKLIRGSTSPAAVFRACLLGLMLGMVPGVNMTSLLLAAALLVLNHSLFLAGIAVLVGKGLCYLLAPVTFQIGYFIIHGLGLEGLFRFFSEVPVVALMNLHVYCLIGGLPVSLVLGGLLGWLLARMLITVHRLLAKAGESSPALAKFTGNRLVRIALWVLFGRQKASFAELLNRRGSLFRKRGLALVGILVVLAAGAEALLAGPILRGQIERGLSAAVGAEVNLAKASLSLLGAKLELKGLQVTDPQDPNRNAVQVGRIAADLSVGSLLARRVVISELALQDLQTGVPRASPGWVKPKEAVPASAPASQPPPPPGLEEAEPLSDFFQNRQRVEQYRQYLRKAREYLQQAAQRRKESKEQKKARATQLAREEGYLNLSAADLLARRPAVTLRKLVATGIKTPYSPAVFELLGEEVSSSPELNESPMTLRLAGSDGTLAMVRLDYQSPERTHRLALNLPDLDAARLTLSDKSPVQVEGGRADLRAEGTFRDDEMLVPVSIRLRNFQGAARTGRGVLGLGPQDTQQAFKYLRDFQVDVVLSGPIDQPRLTVDGQKTLASIRDALVQAGQRELASRAGEQLQKYVGKLPLPAVPGLPGAGNLLPGLGPSASQPGGASPALPSLPPLPGLGAPAPQDANTAKRPGLLDGLLR